MCNWLWFYSVKPSSLVAVLKLVNASGKEAASAVPSVPLSEEPPSSEVPPSEELPHEITVIRSRLRSEVLINEINEKRKCVEVLDISFFLVSLKAISVKL